MSKALFICFHHSPDDARLYHRQAKLLLQELEGLEVAFLYNHKRALLSSTRQGLKQNISIIEAPEFQKKSLLYRLGRQQYSSRYDKWLTKIRRRGLGLWFHVAGLISLFRQAVSYQPTIIQASDVRELVYSVILSLRTNARLIYDVHEETFEFIYEVVNQMSVTGRVKAYIYEAIEFIALRLCSAVYCVTKDIWSTIRAISPQKEQVYMLHNYLPPKLVPQHCNHHQGNKLRLIYAGSVNTYRGVIETCEYIKTFNSETDQNPTVILDIYAPYSRLLKPYEDDPNIQLMGTVGFSELLNLMSEYDVGTCLLLPIEKYKHSIPMKNFEYMAVGLPVITSNFGQCKKYITLAESGIMIDPRSYDQFKAAILRLKDPAVRRKYGQNGITYTQRNEAVTLEFSQYVEQFKRTTS